MANQNKGGGGGKGKAEHKVLVSGSIQTHTTPETEKKNDAERKEDRRRESHKIWLERLTLLAIVVYAGITFWQGCLTRKVVEVAQETYESSQRPYIGVNVINRNFVYWDDKGIRHASSALIKEATNMDFTAEMKNFGPVPGANFYPAWKVLWNDVALKGIDRIPDTPTTLYPSQTAVLYAQLSREEFASLMDGTGRLELQITVAYDGPTRHYTECKRFQYANGIHAFFDLGACTT